VGSSVPSSGSDDGQTVEVGGTGPRSGSPDKGPLEAGDIVDRYRIVSELGRGGMGHVYAAMDPELEREVALKVVRPGRRDADREGEVRMLREAQAMARLSHPNVVPIYAVGTYEHRLFIAMEKVQGQTVAQWLEQPRSPSEVLEVYLEAAKGLIGAHQAGLVHRDFKPSNILIGDDGRVRVMDFGLARSADQGETPHVDSNSDGSSDLTQHGTVMGTPAFMPPEQHMGREVDAAADQYAFCVSLWAGLLGVLPFSGSGMLEQKLKGPPSVTRSGVPKHVLNTLRRGMDPDPERRWPSMEALVAALKRRRAPARWWMLGAAGVGATAAAFGVFGSPASSPCTDANDRLDGVWSDANRADTVASLARSPAPYAEDTAQFVGRSLDAYASQWVDTFREACLAAARGDGDAESVYDLQMRCLDRRREALRSLVDVLGDGGTEVVRVAGDGVARLPDIGDCGDTEALHAEIRPPSDPEVAAKVERIRGQIERAYTVATVGPQSAELDTVVQSIVAAAEPIDYPPLQGEVLLMRAKLAEEAGEIDDAIETLERAHAVAVEAGDDDTAAEAAADLVYVIGYRSGRPDEARPWLRELEARTERLGRRSSRSTRLWGAHVYLAHATQDYERAEEYGRKVLTAMEDKHGPDDPSVARVLMNLGAALFGLRRFDEAQECFERARSIFEATRGAAHPLVAQVLTSLGNAHWMQDDREGALALFQRSVEIGEAAYGEDHIELAVLLGNLASAESELGRMDDAIDHLQRVLAIQEASLGSDNAVTAYTEATLASVLEKKGDYPQARARYESALDKHLRTVGPDNRRTQETQWGLASVLAELGDRQRAREHYEACIAGPDPERSAACKEELSTLDAPATRTHEASPDAR
jgi:tetratricopeptide (TPR) repeat protein